MFVFAHFLQTWQQNNKRFIIYSHFIMTFYSLRVWVDIESFITFILLYFDNRTKDFALYIRNISEWSEIRLSSGQDYFLSPNYHNLIKFSSVINFIQSMNIKRQLYNFNNRVAIPVCHVKNNHFTDMEIFVVIKT